MFWRLLPPLAASFNDVATLGVHAALGVTCRYRNTSWRTWRQQARRRIGVNHDCTTGCTYGWRLFNMLRIMASRQKKPAKNCGEHMRWWRQRKLARHLSSTRLAALSVAPIKRGGIIIDIFASHCGGTARRGSRIRRGALGAHFSLICGANSAVIIIS